MNDILTYVNDLQWMGLKYPYDWIHVFLFELYECLHPNEFSNSLHILCTKMEWCGVEFYAILMLWNTTTNFIAYEKNKEMPTFCPIFYKKVTKSYHLVRIQNKIVIMVWR